MKRQMPQPLYGIPVFIAWLLFNAQGIVAQALPEWMYFNFNAMGNQPNYAIAPVGSNPATLSGLTIGENGQFGAALEGNTGAPAGSCLNTGWGTNLPVTGWTLSLWINNLPAGSPTAQYLFGDTTASVFRCFINGIALNGIMLRGGGLNDVLVPNVLPGPSVVHFVYTGTAVKAYLNGILDNTVAQPSVTITGTGPFRIGAYGNYRFLPTGGLIDEFRLYNRPLSDAEVLATWNTDLMPPVVTTQAATSITATGAVLNGTVNANGHLTIVSFEYGPTTAYGFSVGAVPDTVTGTTITPVTGTLTGLTPNTLYHYRVKGVYNPAVTGSDMTFDLIPSPIVTGPSSPCTGTGNHTYRTQSGKTNYTWSVSAGGTITAGGTVASDSVTVTWNTAGAQSVSVNYENSAGVPAPTPSVYPVTVNPLPVPTISPGPLMSESFENGGSIPVGWEIQTIAPNNFITFPTTTSYPAGYTAYDGTYLVRFDSYMNGNGVVRLKRTIPVSTVGYASANVSFAWLESAAYPIANDRVEVEWSTDGTTWITAGTFLRYDTVQGWKVKTQSLPLTTLGQPTLYVAFKFTSEFGNDCYLDLAKVFVNNTPVCSGTTASYMTEPGMTTYVWTVSAGGTITGGLGTNTIAVLWSSPGNRSVSVNYNNTNGCKAANPTVLAVTVLPPPAPTINGPATTCAYDTVTYRTEKNMTSYLWTISSGGTINGPANDSLVRVIWTSPGSGGSRWLMVGYTNSSGCPGISPVPYPVTVNAVPLPTITGPTSICRKEVGTYQTEPSMTGYTWSVSPGGVILAGQGTKTVTIRWDSAGAGIVSVNYTNAAGCDATVPTQLPVTVHPLPVPTLTGPDSVCVNTSGHTYTTEPGMTGYQWSVPSGGVITAGGTTTSNYATVTWNSTGYKTVSISYTNTNGCTAVAPTVLPVLVSPIPIPVLYGPTSVCVQSPGHIYTTQPGMNTYYWSVSAGGTITSPTDTNVISVTWNTAGSNYVTVNYMTLAGCIAAAPDTLHVTVNNRPVPVITGPTSACAGTGGHVYSTQPGMTNYQWSIPAGGAILSGQGTSMITVVWNTAGPQTVLVNYTNPAGCSALSPGSLAVTVHPQPVPAITGPTPVCQGITGNQYTTESGMITYLWNISPGNTILAGGTSGDNYIIVAWNMPDTQYVYVNYTNPNGCYAQTATSFPVMVNTLPVPTITGPDTVCLNTSGHIYTTEAGQSNYFWTVSAGGSITGGAGTNTITVSWNSQGAQTVSVNWVNGNGCTAFIPTSFPVHVASLPVPTITGPSSVCEGAGGNVYTTQPGMSSYQWLVSGGGTITAGGTSTSSSVTVTWDSAGAQTVSVGYTNTAGCTSANPAVFNVTVHPLPSPTINGPTLCCTNAGNYTYSTETGMTNYQWNVSPSGIITSGAGTPQVQVTWLGPGAQWVSVNYSNVFGCMAAAPITLPVTVEPLPGAAGNITGTSFICSPAAGIPYSVNPIANASSYIWSVPPGAVIASGGGTPSILVDYPEGSSSGDVTVTGTNLCGNGAPSPPFGVTVHPTPPTPVISLIGDLLISNVPYGNQWFLDGIPIPGATNSTFLAITDGEYWDQVTLNNCESDTSNHIYVVVTGFEERSSASIRLYPNPNDGRFFLLFALPAGETCRVILVNPLGVIVSEKVLEIDQGISEQVIDLGPLPDGLYTVLLRSIRFTAVRKILVTR